MSLFADDLIVHIESPKEFTLRPLKKKKKKLPEITDEFSNAAKYKISIYK